MESFVLKVPILGPHLPFQERNAVTRAGFTIIQHSTSKGFRAQMVRLFLVFTYIWQEDAAKIFKVPRIPAQYKSGPSNNMLNRRNHLLYHF